MKQDPIANISEKLWFDTLFKCSTLIGKPLLLLASVSVPCLKRFFFHPTHPSPTHGSWPKSWSSKESNHLPMSWPWSHRSKELESISELLVQWLQSSQSLGFGEDYVDCKGEYCCSDSIRQNVTFYLHFDLRLPSKLPCKILWYSFLRISCLKQKLKTICFLASHSIFL